jgi:hypothetical protein
MIKKGYDCNSSTFLYSRIFGALAAIIPYSNKLPPRLPQKQRNSRPNAIYGRLFPRPASSYSLFLSISSQLPEYPFSAGISVNPSLKEGEAYDAIAGTSLKLSILSEVSVNHCMGACGLVCAGPGKRIHNAPGRPAPSGVCKTKFCARK